MRIARKKFKKNKFFRSAIVKFVIASYTRLNFNKLKIYLLLAFMKQYLDLLKYVMENGEERSDRTGVGTIGVFGAQARFDLRDSFPLLTTKKLHTRSIIYELLWFLKGDTNIKYLNDNRVTIWDEWADSDGNLGRVYGAQWTDWRTPDGKSINQIDALIEGLKKDPFGRRHIVSAWNPGELDKMALPPCHAMFQFHVNSQGELRCQLYQRSADLFLGVPFNIASYAMLTMMVAQVCGYKPREFIHTFGDLHIYKNHIEQVQTQLSREPRALPTLTLNPERKAITEFEFEDFKFEGYDPHPTIKAPIAV